jgi:hypothetical protein
MPTVVPSSQIFQLIEDGAGSTPTSTAAAAFIVHRQSDAPAAPQPYRGGSATAPPHQPQLRPPKRPSTPKVWSVLASTAPKQKYHGTRSDGMRALLSRNAHPADPKTIDQRPPLPSASRRLVRTTPHLPLHPPGHSAARPLDATGVATLHRQPSMVKSACPLGSAPAAPPAPPQGAPGGSGWRALPGRSKHTGRPVTASGA